MKERTCLTTIQNSGFTCIHNTSNNPQSLLSIVNLYEFMNIRNHSRFLIVLKHFPNLQENRVRKIETVL